LLTVHNLAYLARLMADLRAAIAAGTLAERATALRAGAPPAFETSERDVPTRRG
ncbi:MAG: hypothetical protein QOJ46_1217, partial [bacterium]